MKMQDTTIHSYFQKQGRGEMLSKKRESKPLFNVNGCNLSYEQSLVVQNALEGRHVFFTGAAGVGKSLTLHAVIQELRNLHGVSSVYVTASTGIAACNIGGSTLHSFAGVGLGNGTDQQLLNKVKNRPDARKRWQSAKVLIVDEISMIDPDFFSKLDMVARGIRRKHCVVFGGIQLVLAGDFLQLPYVQKHLEEKDSVTGKRNHEATVFLFETPIWKKIFTLSSKPKAKRIKLENSEQRDGITIQLTQIYRQTESDFIQLLQGVRIGEPTEEHLSKLQSLVGVQLYGTSGIQPTRLYPHRVDVKHENEEELSRLVGEAHVFRAR